MEPIQIETGLPIPTKHPGRYGYDNSVIETAISKMNVGDSFLVPKEYTSIVIPKKSRPFLQVKLTVRKMFKNHGFKCASRGTLLGDFPIEEQTMRVWRVK